MQICVSSVEKNDRFVPVYSIGDSTVNPGDTVGIANSAESFDEKFQRIAVFGKKNGKSNPRCDFADGTMDRFAGFHIFELAGALRNLGFTNDHREGKTAFIGIF